MSDNSYEVIGAAAIDRWHEAADVLAVGFGAAGACASNIAQDGAGYSSGTCIGESTFSRTREKEYQGSTLL